MVLFLTFFLFLYGLLHSYLFFRARAALSLGPVPAALLVLFMVFMIVTPILVRLSENTGLTFLARFLSFVGYTWLGLLFLWVCTTVVIDLYRTVLFFSGRALGGDLIFLSLSARSYFLLTCCAVTVIAIYGGFEARDIRTETITIETPTLSLQAGPIRIVQISDVHLGLIVRNGRLCRIVERIKEAKPDLLVSTGDLVDGQMSHLDGISDLIGKISPRLGKFAVTGNHEFYAGLDQALAFTRKAGFRVLRHETANIAGTVTIAGVDDPAGPGMGSSAKGEKTLLSSVPPGQFVLLLKHRPDVDKTSLGLFDLQLSGHVHYGQIFPFRLLTRVLYRFVGGLYALPEGSSIYVNRGTGTWGPPIRFLSPPEVTIIDLSPRHSG